MQSLLNKINRTFSSHKYAFKLNHTQYDADKIKSIQKDKLCALIRYCCSHIKYYKETFRDIDTIRTLEDIENFPILTKEQIRQRFWDFLPNELPSCRLYRTSGSSGIPICILSDESSRINNSAAIIRYRRLYGMNAFSTPILTPLKKKNDSVPSSHWTCVQGFYKTYYVNPYTEEDTEVSADIHTLNKLRKPAIIGITPAIKAIAGRINDRIYPAINPTVVLTVGESLNTQTRQYLEEAFKTQVRDIYACSEAGDIAWQCKHSSLYHINAENVILEVLDKNNKPVEHGQVGEVAITNLNRFSMPFVRYKNGDLARASYEPCSCGCKLPVLMEIIGRSGEDFYLPNGKKMQWNVLKGAMNHNLIRQFQLIQNHDASITVKYIPEQIEKAGEIENLLNERFNVLLSNSLPISYEVVKSIPHNPSGKSKLVICNYHKRNIDN